MKQLQIWAFLFGVLMILGGCGGEPEPDHNYSVVWGGGYGYIDESGTQVIPRQFAYAAEFSEGLGGVNIGGSNHGRNWPQNGKWGFVDLSNYFVINPQYDSPPNGAAPFNLHELSLHLHEGYVFSEHLAPVYQAMNERWIYIDTLNQHKIRGARITTPEGEIKLLPIKSARRFSEGLAAVYVKDDKRTRWGFIDHDGNLVIPNVYRFADNFRAGFAIVRDDNLRQICINTQGQRVFSQYRMVSPFWDSVAVIKMPEKGKLSSRDQELKMGLMDATGRVFFEPQFDYIGRFGSGLAPVLIGSRQDSIVARPEGLNANQFTGGKWGYINRYGRFEINPIYDEAKGFSNGLAAYRIGNHWGYIDSLGNRVYPPQFVYAGYFREDIARVKLGHTYNNYAGHQAYINRTGDVIWIEP